MVLSNKRITKALIRLVCTFVAHNPPKGRFSRVEAHLSKSNMLNKANIGPDQTASLGNIELMFFACDVLPPFR